MDLGTLLRQHRRPRRSRRLHRPRCDRRLLRGPRARQAGARRHGNLAGFTDWLRSLGVPYPWVQARIAMLSELLGGACLALGLFTRPACLVLIGTMALAGILGHKGAGYHSYDRRYPEE